MSCLRLAGLFRLSCAFLVVPLLEQDLLQKVGLDKVDFERSASWQMIFLSKWLIFRFHDPVAIIFNDGPSEVLQSADHGTLGRAKTYSCR